MKTDLSYTYKVDRNLFLLFEYLEILTDSLNLPSKYYTILNNLIIQLDNELFKRPKQFSNYAVVGERLFLTDFFEKEKN